MRFLVDECTGPAVAAWLRAQGHDTASVFDSARGMPDDRVIRWAAAEDRILITNDNHFGEKVFRAGHVHAGVVFLRLADERSATKIAVISRLLATCPERLPHSFVVVTETQIRFARLPGRSG